MTILKVRLETINYAGKKLEVALDVTKLDGKTLFVTYPTAEAILNYESDNVRKKIASKSLKAFIGEGRTVGKFSGLVVNKPELVGASAKISMLHFDDFLKLACWEAFINQNAEIAKLLAVGFGDSFRSLAYEQLGVEIKADERLAWMQARLESKSVFWELTEAIKKTREAAGKTTEFYHYSNAMDAINRGLFGLTAKQIREELGTPESALNRDSFGHTALRRLSNVQESAARRILQKGEDPLEAIADIMSRCCYEQIDFRK